MALKTIFFNVLAGLTGVAAYLGVVGFSVASLLVWPAWVAFAGSIVLKNSSQYCFSRFFRYLVERQIKAALQDNHPEMLKQMLALATKEDGYSPRASQFQFSNGQSLADFALDESDRHYRAYKAPRWYQRFWMSLTSFSSVQSYLLPSQSYLKGIFQLVKTATQLPQHVVKLSRFQRLLRWLWKKTDLACKFDAPFLSTESLGEKFHERMKEKGPAQPLRKEGPRYHFYVSEVMPSAENILGQEFKPFEGDLGYVLYAAPGHARQLFFIDKRRKECHPVKADSATIDQLPRTLINRGLGKRSRVLEPEKLQEIILVTGHNLFKMQANFPTSDKLPEEIPLPNRFTSRQMLKDLMREGPGPRLDDEKKAEITENEIKQSLEKLEAKPSNLAIWLEEDLCLLQDVDQMRTLRYERTLVQDEKIAAAVNVELKAELSEEKAVNYSQYTNVMEDLRQGDNEYLGSYLDGLREDLYEQESEPFVLLAGDSVMRMLRQGKDIMTNVEGKLDNLPLGFSCVKTEQFKMQEVHLRYQLVWVDNLFDSKLNEYQIGCLKTKDSQGNITGLKVSYVDDKGKRQEKELSLDQCMEVYIHSTSRDWFCKSYLMEGNLVDKPNGILWILQVKNKLIPETAIKKHRIYALEFDQDKRQEQLKAGMSVKQVDPAGVSVRIDTSEMRSLIQQELQLNKEQAELMASFIHSDGGLDKVRLLFLLSEVQKKRDFIRLIKMPIDTKSGFAKVPGDDTKLDENQTISAIQQKLGLDKKQVELVKWIFNETGRGNEVLFCLWDISKQVNKQQFIGCVNALKYLRDEQSAGHLGSLGQPYYEIFIIKALQQKWGLTKKQEEEITRIARGDVLVFLWEISKQANREQFIECINVLKFLFEAKSTDEVKPDKKDTIEAIQEELDLDEKQVGLIKDIVNDAGASQKSKVMFALLEISKKVKSKSEFIDYMNALKALQSEQSSFTYHNKVKCSETDSGDHWREDDSGQNFSGKFHLFELYVDYHLQPLAANSAPDLMSEIVALNGLKELRNPAEKRLFYLLTRPKSIAYTRVAYQAFGLPKTWEAFSQFLRPYHEKGIPLSDEMAYSFEDRYSSAFIKLCVLAQT